MQNYDKPPSRNPMRAGVMPGKVSEQNVSKPATPAAPTKGNAFGGNGLIKGKC